MKTITIDARHLYSGIGTYITGLLDYFHGSNAPFRFRLIGPEDRLSTRYPDYDILPCDIPIYTIQEQIKIPLLAKRTDLLHVPHFNVPLLFRGHLVTTVHDTAHYACPELVGNLLKKSYRDVIFRHLVNTSERIITVSRFSAAELVRYTGCPEDKIEVIANGAMPQFSQTGDRTIRNAVSADRPYILYVGNAKPHKNLERQIEAFKRFKTETGLPHRLVLVGQESFDGIAPPDSDEDIEIISDCGTTDLAAIYRDADILLLMSLYEGFGLTPLEAMICDVPVLVSDIPAVREVVGDAGLYADPVDTGDISAKMASLILDTSLRRTLIGRGRTCVSKYSWSSAGDRTLQIYEQVLCRKMPSIRIPV